MTLANSQSGRFSGKQEIIRRQKPDKKSCRMYGTWAAAPRMDKSRNDSSLR